MVLRAAEEPMLIKAMMTRIEREKRMEFIGMGVPRVTTCGDVVSVVQGHAVSFVGDRPCGTTKRMEGLDLCSKTTLVEMRLPGR